MLPICSRKVDRAAMSVSLETRLPLLSPELIEYSRQIPLQNLPHEGQAKAILKNILYKYVPQDLMTRPKSGFSVPIAHRLRIEHKDWTYDILLGSGSNDHLCVRSTIQKASNEHQANKGNHSMRLWALLIFNSWYQGAQ